LIISISVLRWTMAITSFVFYIHEGSDVNSTVQVTSCTDILFIIFSLRLTFVINLKIKKNKNFISIMTAS
jgi:hypothetical protein